MLIAGYKGVECEYEYFVCMCVYVVDAYSIEHLIGLMIFVVCQLVELITD